MPGDGWAVTPLSARGARGCSAGAHGSQAQSQRNKRTAASEPPTAQARSTAERGDVEPSVLQRRPEAGAERARRQGCAMRPQAVPRRRGHQHGAAGATSSTQSRLATASTASLRSVPASSRPSATNAAVPASTSSRAGAKPGGSRRQPSASAERAEHDDLDRLDREHRQHAPGEQAAAAERGGAEQAQHPVAAVEGRADRLPRERRREHGEREHAGHDDVHPGTGTEVGHGGEGQPDERERREHERQQHLLAVAQQDPRVEPGLRERPGARRRAPRRGRARRRPGPPGASSPQRPAGELEEDVLEGAAAEGEALGQDAVGRAPRGHRRTAPGPSGTPPPSTA